MTLSRALRALTVAVVATASTAILLPATALAATTSTATPSATRVVEAPDWAAGERADPLDFSNSEDISRVNQEGTSNLNVSDGRVAFDTTAGGFVEPVYQLGIIPHGSDSTLNPLDGNTYGRMSMRIYSGAASEQAGGFYWFNCWQRVPSCASARSFTLKPGWHTYDFDMKAAPDLLANVAWGPGITGFRIVPSGSTPSPFHVEIDWLRFHPPTAAVTVTVGAPGGNEVWWDSDADPNNNGTAASPGRGAGRLATGVGSGGTTAFNAAAYPPGTYRFYTVQNGQPGPYSSPLVVAPRPQPVMVDPSITTGADYATAVRGDPWDFSQPSDVLNVANFVATFGSGVMTGTAAGRYGDPHFELATTGSIDAAQFHKLTFTIAYDGGFSLADAPGGGMLMRLTWGIDNGNGGLNWFNGQDVVVTPGWQTISYDLRQDPNIIQDETDPYKVGWGTTPSSLQVRAIRFDPHEDPGGRTWAIDDVKLTRDDIAAPSYNFKFFDAAAQGGTVADIGLDTDRSGFDGTPVLSGLAVTGGINQAGWNGRGIGPGTYWPYLVLRSSDGAVTRRYATGQLDVRTPPVNPFGSLDLGAAGAGLTRVAGWAVDPDAATDPLSIHVYSDGRFLGAGPSSVARPDVADAFPGVGPTHGYDLTFADTGGSHNVCSYAINVGPGGNVLLGCRTVNVPTGNPIGALDVATSAAPGTIDVAGWTIDPDTSSPIGVHVYVNGALSGVMTADGTRSDVGTVFPAYGAQHGYGARVPAGAGDNQVCTYGINVGGGGNVLLGCRTVQVGVDPIGVLDVARRAGDGIEVAGWTIDPDGTAPTEAHIYIDGGGAATLVADQSRPDVGGAFPGYGSDHGFSATIPASAGPHTVCAYAINRPGSPGTNRLLSCAGV